MAVLVDMDETFDPSEASVSDLSKRLAAGTLTSAALVAHYQARIASLDKAGPAVNAMIEMNPDAMSIAIGLDAERRAGRLRGPLHGIPIVIKDNLATADRMMTTAGSLAMVGATPPADARVVSALRAAGVVILGKTNMCEWAHFRAWHSTSGWSGRGGLCRNPYALARNTSGSSSGTAVAVTSNFASLGIGTETDGSIISPSSCCGIVGIKPTVGLVSRQGIIPISRSQDTAGPMTRSVADAATLLTVMASTSELTDVGPRPSGAVDYAASLVPGGLRGARIGVVREGLFGYSDPADAIAEDALDVLRREGAVLVDPANIPTLARIADPEMETMLYEFKAGVADYLGWIGPLAPVHSLDDIIAFNERNRDRELPYFGQDTMIKSAQKGPLTTPAYLRARAECVDLSRRQGIDFIMDRHHLDALVAPSGDPAWMTDLVNGDANKGWSATPAAVAGYPHITVPAGFVRGLPVGLSFFGRAWSEALLIKLAYAFERATSQRRQPTFPEHVAL